MKKTTIMIVTLVTAISVLAFVAFAGLSENSGYEEFKKVLKNHQQIEAENGTVTGNIEIIDNGATVLKIESDLNADFNETEDQAMSGDFRIITETLEKELSIYGLKDVMYIHDVANNDVYVGDITDDGHMREGREHNFKKDEEFSKQSEGIMDYFVGDLAKEFNMVKDQDGTMDIEFELTKDEMPAILNLLTTAMSEEHQGDEDTDLDTGFEADCEAYPILKEFYDAQFEMTELVDEVEIEYLKIVLDLDSNKEIVGASFVVNVSGLDENAETHMITVKAEFNISNINNAQIGTIDLEGKNIIQLPEDHEE